MYNIITNIFLKKKLCLLLQQTAVFWFCFDFKFDYINETFSRDLFKFLNVVEFLFLIIFVLIIKVPT